MRSDRTLQVFHRSWRGWLQNWELDVAEVVHRATEVPAHAIGRGHEVGVIAEGYTADLALFDGNLEDNPSVFDKGTPCLERGPPR